MVVCKDWLVNRKNWIEYRTLIKMDLYKALDEFKRIIRRFRVEETREYTELFYPLCLEYLRVLTTILSEVDTQMNMDYESREEIIRTFAEIARIMQTRGPNSRH